MQDKIKKIEVRDYGLILDEITPDNYVLGGGMVPREVIRPNSDWDMFLPDREIQHNDSIDTSNCTGFAFANNIEILMYALFGRRLNYSDRFIGINAGTWPPGNTPHRVGEAIRKRGMVLENLLPFDDSIKTISEYYSPKPMPKWIAEVGGKWRDEYEFKHEWVFKNKVSIKRKRELLFEALKYSPVCVSVRAWQSMPMGEYGEVYYKEPGDIDTHLTVLYGHQDRKFWKVFDTYDNTIKLLDGNYDFLQAKRIHIARREIAYQPSWWDMLTSLLRRLQFS